MAGLENLRISDDDEEVLDVQGEERPEKKADVNLCLVGTFLTQKPIRFIIMRERLATIWELVKGEAIKEVEKGVFVFQFFHILDLQKVVNGGPWYFDNYLLLMGRIGEGEMPSQVPLFHATFWIQVHDLSMGFMSMEIGKALGNFIGEYLNMMLKTHQVSGEHS